MDRSLDRPYTPRDTVLWVRARGHTNAGGHVRDVPRGATTARIAREEVS